MKRPLSALLLALSLAGALVSIFWDALLVGPHSPLHKAARVACPYVDGNALANSLKPFAASPAPGPPDLALLPVLSASDLAGFDGRQGDKIYVGFADARFCSLLPLADNRTHPPPHKRTHAQVAYDVSSARSVFGPGGDFGALAGRHATRAVLLSSTSPQDAVPFVDDLGLPPHAKQSAARILSSRFPAVARLAA
jgi:hypothetical protein